MLLHINSFTVFVALPLTTSLTFQQKFSIFLVAVRSITTTGVQTWRWIFSTGQALGVRYNTLLDLHGVLAGFLFHMSQ